MQSPAPESPIAAIRRYRLLLLAAALYDGILGLVFLFFGGSVLAQLDVPAPENPVYIQLAAGLIAIFGLGFYLASRHPLLNVDIVRLGVVFKVFYIVLALLALVQGTLPHPLFLLFAAVDTLFLALFLIFLLNIAPKRAELERVVSGKLVA
jgi:hypothetical protein